MFCDRSCDCNNGATETKAKTCEKLKRLFVMPVVDPVSDRVPLVGHYVTPGKGRVRGAGGSFISSASSNKHEKKQRKLKSLSLVVYYPQNLRTR